MGIEERKVKIIWEDGDKISVRSGVLIEEGNRFVKIETLQNKIKKIEYINIDKILRIEEK